MTALFGLAVFVWSLAVFVLAAMFLAEVIADLGADGDAAEEPSGDPGRIAIVIPAHDEEQGIAACVANARAELRPGDRLLVVADNCADETAAAAQAAGAEAISRRDPARRGKGYALQFGVDWLRADPPAIVIFTDADCRFAPGAALRLARGAAAQKRPVQALYLMDPPPDPAPRDRVSAFAWLVMNRIRMNGLYRLCGATRLTGAGMAFEWPLIADEPLASGEIVEDLALSIRMIERGAPPALDLGAVVTSALARSESGAVTQRARWENGSLRMARRHAPRLLARGLRGDGKALAFALDLAIPPLALFAAAIAGTLALAAFAALLGSGDALLMAFSAAVAFALGVAIAWSRHGRVILPRESLGGVADYLLAKLRIYGAKGRASARTWTRTDRGDAP